MSNYREEAKRELLRRVSLYRSVFNTETVAGKEVLEDLGRFCRENKSCYHPDDTLMKMTMGRRETFLYIKDMLTLSDEELERKFIPLSREQKLLGATDYDYDDDNSDY